MPRLWMFPWALVCLLAAVAPAGAQSESPPPISGENIPAPVTGYPVFSGGWVHDFAGVLDEATEAEIGGAFEGLAAETGTDAVVVTIRSVGDYQNGRSIEDFATGLFNAWELGDAGVDDGVLLLVAVGDRKARVTIGDGFDDSFVSQSDRVIETMLPFFRDGDYPGGIRAGVGEVTSRFRSLAAGGGTAFPPAGPGAGDGTGSGDTGFEALGDEDDSGGGGGGVPAGVWWGVGAAGTAFAGTGGALVARRIRPRHCITCRRSMKRLKGRAEENEVLDPGQEVEEELDSVEYDVWHCATCNTHQVARYGRFFSGEKKCPSCAYKTLRTDRTTIRAATTSSSGLARVTRECKHCDFHDEREVSIPRVRVSSSSSGSSRSSSRGPSGGGRSSGRGSSGSW